MQTVPSLPYSERPDQVEHNPLLRGTVKVQAKIHRDVYQVFGGKTLIRRAPQVIRGVVVARLSGRRAVQPVLRVVGSVGQKLQHQVGMDGTAFS